MKVWITKYALTSGIFTKNVEVSGELVSWKENGWMQHAHGKGREWHLSFDSAYERADEMRLAKIRSLEKSLAKMRDLTFCNNSDK